MSLWDAKNFKSGNVLPRGKLQGNKWSHRIDFLLRYILDVLQRLI